MRFLLEFISNFPVLDELKCSENVTEVNEGDLVNMTCSMNFTGSQSACQVTWRNEDDVKISSINYDTKGSNC